MEDSAITEERIISGIELLEDQEQKDVFLRLLREEGVSHKFRNELATALNRQASRDEREVKRLAVEITVLDGLTGMLDGLIGTLEDEAKISSSLSSGEGETIGAFLPGVLNKYLAFSVIPLFIVLAVVNWASSFWPPLGLLLNATIYLVAAGLMLFIGFASVRPTVELRSTYYRNLSGATVLFTAAFIALVVSFSQSSRYLYQLFGGFSTESVNSYWGWLRFGITNVMESLLLDAPSIYGFSMSGTAPTSSWSQTWVFGFRTLLEILVIGLVWNTVRTLARYRTYKEPRNGQETYGAYMLAGVGHLIALQAWAIPLTFALTTVLNDGLSLVVVWPNLWFGILVTFGAWLAYRSARAIRVHEGYNKVLALIGLLAGILVVSVVWIML